MELVVLWSKLWKEYNQQQTESPPRAPVPGLAALLATLRYLLRPGSRTPPRPFSPPGTVLQPCPSPSTRAERVWARKTRCAESFGGSRDETRSRPSGCGAVRTRDSRRTPRTREEWGVNRKRVSSREPCSRYPGGMKGRGGVAWAETGPIRATKERGYPAQRARARRGLSRCLNWRLSSNSPRLIRPSPVLIGGKS